MQFLVATLREYPEIALPADLSLPALALGVPGDQA
jgi:hypothetical protein